MEPKKLTPQRLAGNAKRAFTLIELLIVITIIAIMIGAATYSWNNARMKGRDGKRKTDLKAVQQALEMYFQTNGKYPDSSAAGLIRCNVGTSADLSWGSLFSCNSITYMQQLPKDPVSTNSYYYNNPNANSYNLWADLENSSDPDLTNRPSSCPSPPGTRDYCVVNP